MTCYISLGLLTYILALVTCLTFAQEDTSFEGEENPISRVIENNKLFGQENDEVVILTDQTESDANDQEESNSGDQEQSDLLRDQEKNGTENEQESIEELTSQIRRNEIIIKRNQELIERREKFMVRLGAMKEELKTISTKEEAEDFQRRFAEVEREMEEISAMVTRQEEGLDELLGPAARDEEDLTVVGDNDGDGFYMGPTLFEYLSVMVLTTMVSTTLYVVFFFCII